MEREDGTEEEALPGGEDLGHPDLVHEDEPGDVSSGAEHEQRQGEADTNALAELAAEGIGHLWDASELACVVRLRAIVAGV